MKDVGVFEMAESIFRLNSTFIYSLFKGDNYKTPIRTLKIEHHSGMRFYPYPWILKKSKREALKTAGRSRIRVKYFRERSYGKCENLRSWTCNYTSIMTLKIQRIIGSLNPLSFTWTAFRFEDFCFHRWLDSSFGPVFVQNRTKRWREIFKTKNGLSWNSGFVGVSE